MKKKAFIIGIVLGIVGLLWFTYGEKQKKTESQRKIASQVIRLHVVANSDEKDDQELKKIVKDRIVEALRDDLSKVTNVDEAREVLRRKSKEVEQIAESQMHQLGYSYVAKADLGNSYFPVKRYGDMTFPEGEYEALRVELGEAEGKNWWCVMYPTLCFVDSTYCVVPREQKEKFKKDLSAEDYQRLLGDDEDITYGFKLVEWVADLFK